MQTYEVNSNQAIFLRPVYKMKTHFSESHFKLGVKSHTRLTQESHTACESRWGHSYKMCLTFLYIFLFFEFLELIPN